MTQVHRLNNIFHFSHTIFSLHFKMDVNNKIRMIGLKMENKRKMLNIFKGNPSWSQQTIVDEFNNFFNKEVNRSTISQVFNSS